MLYHFSEQPGIAEFVPRPQSSPGGVYRDLERDAPVVWAIDEWHSPLYYFPRDCPRIVFWALPETTVEDRERWLAATAARQIACIERAWLDRLKMTTIYRYGFEGTSFRYIGTPGTWVSERAIRPLTEEPIADLPGALQAAGVELRLMPSLVPLRGIWDTTLHASGIRLRNAAGWAPVWADRARTRRRALGDRVRQSTIGNRQSSSDPAPDCH